MAGAPVRVPPPPNFRRVQGTVLSAGLRNSHWTPPKGQTSAQRAGMRYEEKVHEELFKLFSEEYIRSPNIFFSDDTGLRTCIPDGVIVNAKNLCIVEIKSQHMPEAWWQLRHLYAPVVECLYWRKPILLEVCRSYDAATPFPEVPQLVYDVKDFLSSAKASELGVHRWKL